MEQIVELKHTDNSMCLKYQNHIWVLAHLLWPRYQYITSPNPFRFSPISCCSLYNAQKHRSHQNIIHDPPLKNKIHCSAEKYVCKAKKWHIYKEICSCFILTLWVIKFSEDWWLSVGSGSRVIFSQLTLSTNRFHGAVHHGNMLLCS